MKLVPQEPDGADATMARLLIDKELEGDLSGRSRGQMLSCRSAVDGSAGYVAIERITGTLDGREGSFALQHFGVMTRGTPEQDIRVVPDSGTGALEGISGTFRILIEDGAHSYEFDYSLPE